MIQDALAGLQKNENLSSATMQSVMEEIMTGKASVDEIVSFLKALSKKGETVEEITAAARVMRKFAVKIDAGSGVILDTCGTGGDKKGTFNVSTACAFVACGAGITVAKHGNRSISSQSGSADILEALGIQISLSKETLEKSLKEIGIAFLFAPSMHPAMKYAMPARKKIGEKTVFNILGPLTNPAGATHQVVGVYDKKWTEVIANVLLELGSKHVTVLHGEDGLDEATISAATFVSEGVDTKTKSFAITPEEFGIKRAPLDEIKGAGAKENADILLSLLKGEKSAYRDIVLLNSGIAIYTADKAGSIKEGIEIAKQSIDSGAALTKLELLKRFSRENYEKKQRA